MSYEFYKILHIFGLLTLFSGLITILILAQTRQLSNKAFRVLGFATHGTGLFLMILSGFGMAARLGYFASLPGWLYAKIAIWVVLGAIVALLRRKPQLGGWPSLALLLALGTTAAWLAIAKPF